MVTFFGTLSVELRLTSGEVQTNKNPNYILPTSTGERRIFWTININSITERTFTEVIAYLIEGGETYLRCISLTMIFGGDPLVGLDPTQKNWGGTPKDPRSSFRWNQGWSPPSGHLRKISERSAMGKVWPIKKSHENNKIKVMVASPFWDFLQVL